MTHRGRRGRSLPVAFLLVLATGAGGCTAPAPRTPGAGGQAKTRPEDASPARAREARIAACREALARHRMACESRTDIAVGARGPGSVQRTGPGSYDCLAARLEVERACAPLAAPPDAQSTP